MSFIGVLMTCIIVIVALFLGFTIMLAVIASKENKPKEQNIEHVEGGNKKALIVYHNSPNGTVKRGVDVSKKKLKQMKYSVDLYVARPDLELDVNSYDVIMLAAPSYMGSPAKPIIDFTIRHEFKNKRVIIFINGQFINSRKDLEVLNKYIEMTNIVLLEKTSGNFDELEKTIEKIEDKRLKPKGYEVWERMKNEEKQSKSLTSDKK